MTTHKFEEYASPVCRVYSVTVESVMQSTSGSNSANDGYDNDYDLGEV